MWRFGRDEIIIENVAKYFTIWRHKDESERARESNARNFIASYFKGFTTNECLCDRLQNSELIIWM